MLLMDSRVKQKLMLLDWHNLINPDAECLLNVSTSTAHVDAKMEDVGAAKMVRRWQGQERWWKKLCWLRMKKKSDLSTNCFD